MIQPPIRLFLFLTILALVSCKEELAAAGSHKKTEVIDQSLIVLVEEYDAYLADGASLSDFQSSITGLMVVEDRVIIDAVARNHGAELKRQMEELGGIHCSSYELLVSCHFPITNIEKLEGLQGLRFVRPAMATTHETGN